MYHEIEKSIYEKELQKLKPEDEVQVTTIDEVSGLNFIHTAGHGYLVVPKDHKNALAARKICNSSFWGKLAYYLEEDDEASEFYSVTRSKRLTDALDFITQ